MFMRIKPTKSLDCWLTKKKDKIQLNKTEGRRHFIFKKTKVHSAIFSLLFEITEK